MKEHHFIRNIIFILFMISFVCGLIGWRLNTLGYKELLNEKNKENDICDYYGIRVTLMENNQMKDQYFDLLYIRDDGTYYLSVDSYYTNAPVTGTYTVDGNIIHFHETARYSSDMCFYTNDLKEYDGTITEGLIIINMNETKYEFAKGFGIKETNTNRNFYSAHPVDGQFPEGFLQTWNDCTNK